MRSKNILFKVCGSIAAYKSGYVVSRLIQRGHKVKVVMTSSATQFIGKATFEGLTGEPVLTDVFSEGSMMSHIDLDRWADMIVVCPASANTINEMASGVGHSLVTNLFLAHDFKKPYLVFPAMNEKMFDHPATQESLRKLTEWGIRVMPVEEGRLACGEVGKGKLLEPDQILNYIDSALKENEPFRGRVLITSGGTSEKIDEVRFITNFSSGETGARIADYFCDNGFEVTYLHASRAALPNRNCQNVGFFEYQKLEEELRTILSSEHFDLVIHAAAVSDYSVSKIYSEQGEISKKQKISSNSKLFLELEKTRKLINQLRIWSKNKKVLLVGFKLTVSASENERELAAREVLKSAQADYVVVNDLTQIIGTKHEGRIYSMKDSDVRSFANKSELAEQLLIAVESEMDKKPKMSSRRRQSEVEVDL